MVDGTAFIRRGKPIQGASRFATIHPHAFEDLECLPRLSKAIIHIIFKFICHLVSFAFPQYPDELGYHVFRYFGVPSRAWPGGGEVSQRTKASGES